jgi:hypothetical protein
MFRGTFTALVTPFRDNAIDVSAFEKLIETQIAAGITGIVAVGTTGESPRFHMRNAKKRSGLRLQLRTNAARSLPAQVRMQRSTR